MERYWNYIHYYIYIFERKASKIITYPLSLIFDSIYKIPFILNQLKNKGISREELQDATDNAINNPKYGQNLNIAGIHMGGLLVLIEYSLFNLIQVGLRKSFIEYIWEDDLYKWIFIAGLLVIPWIVNHNLLWKGDKYLEYFREFEKEPNRVRRKWAWISISTVLGVILLFILSLVIISNRV